MTKQHCRYYETINEALEVSFFNAKVNLVLLSKVLK
jgi:hypothetical protein